MFNISEHLFNGSELSGYIRNIVLSAQDTVDRMSKDQFLISTDEQILEHILSNVHVVPIKLYTDPEQLSMDQHETTMQISDFGDKVTIRATRLDIEIPFTGTAHLLMLTPSARASNPPRATLKQNSIIITITKPHDASEDAFKRELDSILATIRQYVERINRDVANIEQQIVTTAKAAISKRRDALKKHEGLSQVLNIPLKSKDGAPPVTPIPIARKITKPLPTPPKSGFQPQPGIDDKTYEDILNMIRHEGRTYEGAPSTFCKLVEEELRDNILAHLNGHFEGAASGETFRKKGKTDIRIEEKDRSAFVGECKIWGGANEVNKAINQLLGYLTWRDCKASLIIFNKKTKGFTELFDKLSDAISQHPNLIKRIEHNIPGEWRYILQMPEDENLRITLHVFLFNLCTE